MNPRTVILNNLAERVQAVNAYAATAGTDERDGQLLEEMVCEGLVNKTYMGDSRRMELPLYRISFFGRKQLSEGIRVVVDNTK